MGTIKGIGPPTGKKQFGTRYLDAHSNTIYIQKGDFNSPNWQAVSNATSTVTEIKLLASITDNGFLASPPQTLMVMEPGITLENSMPMFGVIYTNTTAGNGDNVYFLAPGFYLSAGVIIPTQANYYQKIPITLQFNREMGEVGNTYILGTDSITGFGVNDFTAYLYGYVLS